MMRATLCGVLLIATLAGCATGPATPTPAGSPATASGPAATGSSATGTSATGISGQVVAGPQCPVQPVPALSTDSSRCADRPVQATVQVTDAATGRVVTTVRTSPDGWFQIPLAPGRYQVQVLDPPTELRARPAPPVEVTVTGMVQVRLYVDTGIR
jgi:hypothetical protein